jgi:hypothetical protein
MVKVCFLCSLENKDIGVVAFREEAMSRFGSLLVLASKNNDGPPLQDVKRRESRSTLSSYPLLGGNSSTLISILPSLRKYNRAIWHQLDRVTPQSTKRTKLEHQQDYNNSYHGISFSSVTKVSIFKQQPSPPTPLSK